MAERDSIIRRFSQWIMGHRALVLAVIGGFTALFLYGATRIEVKTIFNDLLPLRHPYIKTHIKYQEQLGDPLKILLMLRVKEGDIYNQETLKKVQRITNALDLIKGVNHYQVFSLASSKVKKVTITSDSIAADVLFDEVPTTKEGMETFKQDVRTAGTALGLWVSIDEKSVLFSAGFIAERVDYKDLFQTVNRIIKSETDENHIIYAAGEPILTGWIYSYQKELYRILAITLLALICLLYFYFRNFVGVICPLVSTGLGLIWGVGFCGLLGLNLEPLTVVVPLLISARALSHSVQMTERYFECYEEHKQVIPACVECTISIFPPGLLGVLADAGGIILIAVAPIPIMQKLAYICTFWSIAIIPTCLIFTPIFISFFPPPKNIPQIVDIERGMTQRLLGKIAKVGFGKAGIATVVIAALIAGYTGWVSTKVDIGDVNPGTPILWQDSDYNTAIGQINRYFPGTEELYVIVEGSEDAVLQKPEVLNLIQSFQRHMERSPVVAATTSISDFLRIMQMNLNGGYPKWERLPETKNDAGFLFYALMGSAAPGDFDRYFSRSVKDANIICWCKDHMGDTVRGAVSWAKKFIEDHKEAIAKAKVNFRLASGNIGVLAAVNETVKGSQLLNFVLVMGVVFGLCTVTYRSMLAAIILMIPLNLANLITMSIMKWLGIGLNINTLPIVSIGVGVGIDYGIYLLSRLCEECQKTGEYSFKTLSYSLHTTGKAIFFTATTMTAGVIFFYFLSSLRFQAEMGLLLAIIMFLNMVGALILIPALVYVFKPKFLRKANVLV